MDIKPASAAAIAALREGGLRPRDAEHEDFVLGHQGPGNGSSAFDEHTHVPCAERQLVARVVVAPNEQDNVPDRHRRVLLPDHDDAERR